MLSSGNSSVFANLLTVDSPTNRPTDRFFYGLPLLTRAVARSNDIICLLIHNPNPCYKSYDWRVSSEESNSFNDLRWEFIKENKKVGKQENKNSTKKAP